MNENLTPTGRPKKSSVMVTHKQLIKQVAESSGYPAYAVEDVVNHYLYNIAMNLKNTDLGVELFRLGVFKTAIWSERERFNVSKQEYVKVPARRRVGFKASKTLRTTINQEKDTNEK